MKAKKLLPEIITAILSLILLIYAFVSSKVNVGTYPFKLFEKAGIYYGDTGYGVLNDSFSANGSYEGFISLLKKLSVSGVIHYAVPYIIFSVLLISALTVLSRYMAKTNYRWTIYLSSVLLPVVFCDFTNIAYFKTLYSQPLTLVLILLICGVLLKMYTKNKASAGGIILAGIITLIYSLLGTVQAISALIFGIVIILLLKISKSKGTKILSVLTGLIIITESLLFAFNCKAFDYKQSLYNSVFFGVCKYDSVTSLGLSKDLDDFKEVYYGMMENEEDYDLENTFYSKMSYSKVIKYYITHPDKAIKVINNQAKGAFYNQNDFGFTAFSKIKMLYIPMNFIIALAFAAVYILIAAIIGRKYREFAPVTGFLSAVAVMWFVTLIATSVYHGNCDISQNMFTFNILFDILIVGAVTGGIRIIIKGQDEKKEEFGITHE